VNESESESESESGRESESKNESNNEREMREFYKIFIIIWVRTMLSHTSYVES